MIKNYFKIAWRNLYRNKGFSISNVLGLTIGITCTILILLWVQDELTYNKFQKNYNDIQQVLANRNFDGKIFTDDAIVFPLAKEMEKNLPQVKNAVVSTYSESHVLSVGENKLKKNGYTVSDHYFNIFSWKFLEGDAATAISQPNTIVLTESAARSFFGNSNPIGKLISMDNQRNVTVSAIVADVPSNSTMQFDFIQPYNYDDGNIRQAQTEWRNSFSNVFIQTVPGADLGMLAKNMNALVKQHDPNDKVSTYFFQPMHKWRLYSDFKEGVNTGGMIEYVRLFSIIACIILLIACVNFMNLSTARSEKRAKEVGIRKTLGSAKSQLILQFLFESLILALIAFVFSLIIIFLLLPSFNLLVNKHLGLPLNKSFFWLWVSGIVLFTGLVAGSYPALYLSSFNPVKVLKGTFFAGKKAMTPRRILVVAQFIISILLISATAIVYQQIMHVKNRDIGYNPDNLVMIPSGTPELDKSFPVVKDEMLKTGLFEAVTRTSMPITDIWNYSPAPDWAGKPAGMNMLVAAMRTDADFAKTMGIKMIAGKDFSGSVSDTNNLLLNAAAVKAMGLKHPLGMEFTYNNRKFTLIGITSDVVMSSPFKPVDPIVIFYRPDYSNFISARVAKNVKPQVAIAAMEPIFKKHNPAIPFEYQFADLEFGKKFAAEELISKLTNIFAALAIFICCLGLAGLASFTIEKRIREIGVRKVLGASVRQLLMLISTEFLKLVMVAFVIAVPLGWWLMNNWLQHYEYRVGLSLWLFGIVGVLILLLTLLVVGANTIKAAMRNPVKSLRTE
jgi:ABC-type antimicrobial peptide transport system permease subunit